MLHTSNNILLPDILHLLKCFPSSYIKSDGTFLYHPDAKDVGFNLSECETKLDMKVKILQNFSILAANIPSVLDEVNQYLKSNFTKMDMRAIAACELILNTELTLKFIKSDYDMSILYETLRDCGYNLSMFMSDKDLEREKYE